MSRRIRQLINHLRSHGVAENLPVQRKGHRPINRAEPCNFNIIIKIVLDLASERATTVRDLASKSATTAHDFDEGRRTVVQFIAVRDVVCINF